MPFVVFRGERKLDELVERAFGSKLTPAQHKRAVTAFERANPLLADLNKLPRGTLVVIPEVAGVAPAPSARRDGADDPGGALLRELADAVDDHRGRLSAAVDPARERVGAVRAILDSSELRQLASQEPGGTKQLEAIGSAVTLREEAIERAERASGDLGDVAKELREFADTL